MQCPQQWPSRLAWALRAAFLRSGRSGYAAYPNGRFGQFLPTLRRKARHPLPPNRPRLSPRRLPGPRSRPVSLTRLPHRRPRQRPSQTRLRCYSTTPAEWYPKATASDSSWRPGLASRSGTRTWSPRGWSKTTRAGYACCCSAPGCRPSARSSQRDRCQFRTASGCCTGSPPQLRP